MKVFRNQETAQASREAKDPIWLNSDCPFYDGRVVVGSLQHPKTVLCGSWCALFHAFKEDSNGKVKFVILGCKGTDKHLYVKDVEHVKA